MFFWDTIIILAMKKPITYIVLYIARRLLVQWIHGNMFSGWRRVHYRPRFFSTLRVLNVNEFLESLLELEKNNWCKNGKNDKNSVVFGDFLHNQSTNLHEILCEVVSPNYLRTSFSDQIDSMMLPLLGFSKNWKNCQIIFLMSIFTTRGGADPKVMGTVGSGSSMRFFWHLRKSNQTYGSWVINSWPK